MSGSSYRFIAALIVLSTGIPYGFAMSPLSTVNRAKTTFDLSQVLISEPNRIVALKTDIDSAYQSKNNFSGLNNKVVENIDGGSWLLKNTVIKTEPINGVADGGYSITTDNASYKACNASKIYYSEKKLATRQLLIDGIENGRCKIFATHKITLIFD